jgi:lactonase
MKNEIKEKIPMKSSASQVGPLPPELVNLPTMIAEPWLEVDTSTKIIIEGPAFDREGNLFVNSVHDCRIFKITPRKKVSLVFSGGKFLPDGNAFHKDGRLFIACVSGELVSMNPDGSDVKYHNAKYKGKPQCINDLVFNSQGYLYVTDFTGNIANPTGGVYRYSEDFLSVQPVVVGLATPNGISISPDGTVLWVGETNRNTVLRIGLQPDGITLNPIESVNVAFYSTGSPGGPDSNKVDVDGNLYQCIMAQGRVVVLNKYGIPVANVVVSGREEGRHMRTANLAFKPGTDEAYITASGEGGAWIYKFKGLARGLPLFSHS